MAVSETEALLATAAVSNTPAEVEAGPDPVSTNSPAATESVTYLPAQNLEAFTVLTKGNGPGKDPDGVFNLTGGTLVASEESGAFIVTNAEHENFRLEVDYRWRTDRANRDSGIFLHCKGAALDKPLKAGDKMRSIEVNLLGPERLKQNSFSGQIWLFAPNGKPVELTVGGKKHKKRTQASAPAEDFENHVGEWNTMEITSANGSFLVILNGNVVVEGTDPLPSSGRIALQSGGVEFGRMVVTPVRPSPAASTSNSSRRLSDGLNVYGAIPGLDPSDKYALRVRQEDEEGAWQDAFALITRCKNGDGGKTNNYIERLNGWSNTYINFEMSQPVEIEISKAGGAPIVKAVAHPKHRVASCMVRDGKAYVVMKEPALIAVDINGQMDDQDTGKGYRGPPIHTVTVFANPFLTNLPEESDPLVYTVEPGEDPPKDGAWKTLRFSPGIYDIGVGYPLRAGRNYYIPGDAIVYGTMNNLHDRRENHDIRIFGHGTLSGARIAHPRFSVPPAKDPKMHNSIRIIDASNTTVEGITLADAAHHALQMQNRKNPEALTTLRWAKVFTWRGNGDGMGADANGLMEDCFMRTQDDCTYVMPRRAVRRVTFWNDWNGSAFVLSGLPNRKTIIEDCDIIYARAGWHHWGGGRVFNMRGEGGGDCGAGVIFRNIRVSDPRPTLQPFMIAMQNLEPYGNPDKNKRKPGHLSGVLFQNIEIAASSVLGERDVLWGTPEAQIRNITFDNVTIGGKKITSIDHFKHNEDVKDLVFK